MIAARSHRFVYRCRARRNIAAQLTDGKRVSAALDQRREIIRHNRHAQAVTAFNCAALLGPFWPVVRMVSSSSKTHSIAIRQLAQVIFFADLNAIVAQDGVGGGHMKIHIRHGVLGQELRAG